MLTVIMVTEDMVTEDLVTEDLVTGRDNMVVEVLMCHNMKRVLKFWTLLALNQRGTRCENSILI